MVHRAHESRLLEETRVDTPIVTHTSSRSKPSPIPAYDRLGKHITLNSHRLQHLGWNALVASARGLSDIAAGVDRLRHPAAGVDRLRHPAAGYLSYLRVSGAPSKQRTAPWPRSKRDAAMDRGAHFLYEEMADMVDKAQWIVLPYSLVERYPDLRISPIGVVPQHKRPPTIVDYTYSGVNADTAPLCAPEAMQFGRALLRILQRIVHADPSWCTSSTLTSPMDSIESA
jgi:hypothetical protein